MGTGATMTVSNQTNAIFTTTLSNLNCMYENGDDGSALQVFQGLGVPAYSTSPSQYIEADGSFPSCSFSQSSFQINYLNGSLGINLGTAPDFNTAVTSNTNPALLQAVLAPTVPVESGPSYTFYFYGGPGIAAPLVNSVIGANLAAFAAAVQAQPFVAPIGGGASLSISGVNLSSLVCPYAAAVPVKPGELQFTATLSATGTLSGTLALGPGSTSVDVSVTDLLVLVEGTADLSQARPAITVTRFACSLGDYSINSALLELLVTLPGWLLLKTFATAPDVAGIINGTGLNQTIVNGLNDALRNL
jgi:hypothetical protein